MHHLIELVVAMINKESTREHEDVGEDDDHCFAAILREGRTQENDQTRNKYKIFR